MKFELSLSKNYVAEWTLQDALREFIQNAIDQENTIEDNKMTITYDSQSESILIQNKKSVLEKKTLLLGTTSKAEDDKSIGKFGEGYKIALLVLTRMGKKVTIYNYGSKEVWTSRFVKSKKYEGAEVLTIEVDKKFVWESVPNNDLTIKIEGISNEDYTELVQRTLFLQGVIEHLDCIKGKILLDPKYKGKIFVNGLFINQNDAFSYGYDIKPKYLDIGRDRNLTNSCNIQFQTCYMWSEYPEDDRLKKLLRENAYDVEHINFCYEDYNILKISDNLYGDYVKEEQEENIVFVSTQKEYDNVAKEYEDVKPVIVSNKIKNIMEKSYDYKESKNNFVKKEVSKEDKYTLWKSKYSHELSYEAEKDLDDLIEELLTK